jgi:Ca2+-dependent lipid-binding protein
MRSNAGGRTIEITLIEGKLYRDTEVFGAMDPFISLKYKMHEYKTKALDRGGKSPKWNETLTIPIDSIDDQITITCIDDDGASSFDIVGAETFKISLLLTKTASGPA